MNSNTKPSNGSSLENNAGGSSGANAFVAAFLNAVASPNQQPQQQQLPVPPPALAPTPSNAFSNSAQLGAFLTALAQQQSLGSPSPSLQQAPQQLQPILNQKQQPMNNQQNSATPNQNEVNCFLINQSQPTATGGQSILAQQHQSYILPNQYQQQQGQGMPQNQALYTTQGLLNQSQSNAVTPQQQYQVMQQNSAQQQIQASSQQYQAPAAQAHQWYQNPANPSLFPQQQGQPAQAQVLQDPQSQREDAFQQAQRQQQQHAQIPMPSQNQRRPPMAPQGAQDQTLIQQAPQLQQTQGTAPVQNQGQLPTMLQGSQSYQSLFPQSLQLPPQQCPQGSAPMQTQGQPQGQPAQMPQVAPNNQGLSQQMMRLHQQQRQAPAPAQVPKGQASVQQALQLLQQHHAQAVQNQGQPPTAQAPQGTQDQASILQALQLLHQQHVQSSTGVQATQGQPPTAQVPQGNQNQVLFQQHQQHTQGSAHTGMQNQVQPSTAQAPHGSQNQGLFHQTLHHQQHTQGSLPSQTQGQPSTAQIPQGTQNQGLFQQTLQQLHQQHTQGSAPMLNQGQPLSTQVSQGSQDQASFQQTLHQKTHTQSSTPVRNHGQPSTAAKSQVPQWAQGRVPAQPQAVPALPTQPQLQQQAAPTQATPTVHNRAVSVGTQSQTSSHPAGSQIQQAGPPNPQQQGQVQGALQTLGELLAVQRQNEDQTKQLEGAIQKFVGGGPNPPPQQHQQATANEQSRLSQQEQLQKIIFGALTRKSGPANQNTSGSNDIQSVIANLQAALGALQQEPQASEVAMAAHPASATQHQEGALVQQQQQPQGAPYQQQLQQQPPYPQQIQFQTNSVEPQLPTPNVELQPKTKAMQLQATLIRQRQEHSQMEAVSELLRNEQAKSQHVLQRQIEEAAMMEEAQLERAKKHKLKHSARKERKSQRQTHFDGPSQGLMLLARQADNDSPASESGTSDMTSPDSNNAQQSSGDSDDNSPVARHTAAGEGQGHGVVLPSNTTQPAAAQLQPVFPINPPAFMPPPNPAASQHVPRFVTVPQQSQEMSVMSAPNRLPDQPTAPVVPLNAVLPTRKRERGRPGVFPQKIHQMLGDLERLSMEDIASFLPGNDSYFAIHKNKEFVNCVMPTYFNTNNFASFQRQMNMYGFQRVTEECPERGAYYHELFRKNQPLLSTRIKRKQGNKKPAPSPAPAPVNATSGLPKRRGKNQRHNASSNRASRRDHQMQPFNLPFAAAAPDAVGSGSDGNSYSPKPDAASSSDGNSSRVARAAVHSVVKSKATTKSGSGSDSNSGRNKVSSDSNKGGSSDSNKESIDSNKGGSSDSNSSNAGAKGGGSSDSNSSDQGKEGAGKNKERHHRKGVKWAPAPDNVSPSSSS